MPCRAGAETRGGSTTVLQDVWVSHFSQALHWHPPLSSPGNGFKKLRRTQPWEPWLGRGLVSPGRPLCQPRRGPGWLLVLTTRGPQTGPTGGQPHPNDAAVDPEHLKVLHCPQHRASPGEGRLQRGGGCGPRTRSSLLRPLWQRPLPFVGRKRLLRVWALQPGFRAVSACCMSPGLDFPICKLD